MSEAKVIIAEYEIGGFKESDGTVEFMVSRTDGKCRTDDERKIDDLFKHLGKWERLVNGFSHLLEEINIGKAKHYEGPFGYERYLIKTRLDDDGIIRVEVGLTAKERSLRKDNLKTGEILGQVQNLSKWVAFLQSVRSVPLF